MKNRIFSIFVTLILTLSLILGIVVIANAEGAMSGEYADVNMSLAENVTVGIAFNIVNPQDNAYAIVALPNGDELRQELKDADVVDGRYVFYGDVAIKDFEKAVSVTVFDANGGVVASATKSALDYCEQYLGSYPDGEFAELIGTLKVYAKAAEDYFVTEGDQPIVPTDYNFDGIADAVISGALPEGIYHRSATLLLESEMTIRHYFELTGEKAIDDYKFYVGKTEITPCKKGGLYYVDIEGITPNEIDRAYTVSVKAGGDRYTCAYSALTYVKRIYKNGKTSNDAKNLVSAIAAYNQAASKLKGTVRFVDGETVVDTLEYKYGVSSPVAEAPIPADPTKVFASWVDGNQNIFTKISASMTGDITLTAKWATALYQQAISGISSIFIDANDFRLADDGSELLNVTVTEGDSKVGFQKYISPKSGALTLSMTLSKDGTNPFPGFSIRLRSSSTNPSNFMYVSSGGVVTIAGTEVAQLSVDPTELTVIFTNHPTNNSAMLMDVYIDGQPVAEALEYVPGFNVASVARFYLLFNYDKNYLGSLYFKDLDLIDGMVVPSNKSEDSDEWEEDMENPEVTDATFSTVLMNVGADETKRNLTWYSDYKTDGEIRWAKATDLVNGEFPKSYKSAPALVNTTTKTGYYSYKATISGLEENTSYAYVLVTGATVSEIYTFDVKAFSDEYTFVFAGDPQVGVSGAPSWSDTLQKIKKYFSDTAFVVSGGDQTSTATNEKDYETFAVPELTWMPVAVTLGPGHDNANTYTMHYNPPNLSSTYGVSATTSDYYYTYNSTLFLHINVESGSYASHEAFIRSTVANNPDCIWQVAVIHYSAYSGLNNNTEFRNALSAVYAECGIDVVLSGHDHVYARSQLMIDSCVVSDDVIKNGTVTDPSGVLYISGAPSTNATGFTADPGCSDYTLKQSFEERKSVVVFTMTETSMTLTAYFLDGDEPEAFDTFTIYRTAQTVRLNGDTEKLEITTDGGESRTPLVNAYAYKSATVKAIDGYWSITEDGVNYTSLGISAYAEADGFVLSLNTQTGYWELSTDGGDSFTALPINAKKYSITYVTDFEASADAKLSDYTKHYFAEGESPDDIALPLPPGSVAEGKLYEWSWKYYSASSDALVTEFSVGEAYVARLARTVLHVSNTLYIATATNANRGIYTWSDAWDIVNRFPGTEFKLLLIEDIELSSGDAAVSSVPTNVKIDLAGHKLDSTALTYLIRLNNGTDTSNISIVTSKKNGTLNARSVFYMYSGARTTIHLTLGGEGSEPISVSGTCLIDGGNNYKNSSHLYLDVNEGNYEFSESLLLVIAYSENYNYYYVTMDGASLSVGKAPVEFYKTYHARLQSTFKATSSSFTYTGTATDSPFFSANQWLGTAEFADCEFDGITLAPDYVDGTAGITISDGCIFKNSGASFNSDSTAPTSGKVTLAEGCIIVKNDGYISVEKIKEQ